MLESSPLVTALSVAVLTASAAAGLVLLQQAPHRAELGVADQSSRTIRARALCIGSGFVAFSAFMAGSPALAWLMGLSAMLTSPTVLTQVRRRAMARPNGLGPTDRPATPIRSSGVSGAPAEARNARADATRRSLQALDDKDLCCLWRHTYWELQSRHTPDHILHMVVLRQSCLEELERRNPSALHAWLASGGRASGGPERFWHGASRPGDDIEA
jgi:hypothetical protein